MKLGKTKKDSSAGYLKTQNAGRENFLLGVFLFGFWGEGHTFPIASQELFILRAGWR